MPLAKVTLTESVVAFVNETVLAFVIAPVEPLINCTWGIETKFVPVIFIVVAVAGAIVWDTSATVGLVSYADTQLNCAEALPFVAKTWPLLPDDVGKVQPPV